MPPKPIFQELREPVLYQNFKNLLFCLDPEKAHHLGLKAIPWLSRLFSSQLQLKDKRLHVELDGLHFENPVGLAAGFDKSGTLYPALKGLGFGFAEIGTFTPLPQPGNPKPRLFRIPSHQAVVNRMGFNNEGAEVARRFIEKHPADLPLGINIGKNKVTPLGEAVDDYVKCFKSLAHLADSVIVNVSSPNTPGLRSLQDKGALKEIFSALNELNVELKKPLWLKVAPDLSEEGLEDIVEVVLDQKIYGVIATNTSIDHSSIPENLRPGDGGLSGAPIVGLADKTLEFLTSRLFGKCRFIGVGGITTPEDAIRKIALGADLVQVYSGWIYAGPTFCKTLCAGLLAHLEKESMSLAELRGSLLK